MGSIVLAIGFFRTNDEIQKEAGTYYGSNPHLKASMARDRRMAIIGTTIMSLGFIFSFVGSF